MFMTDTTNYYYSVISLDLKNGKATYQRLMDSECVCVYIFVNQLDKI